jgi:lipopolysaccharide export system protein LptA
MFHPPKNNVAHRAVTLAWLWLLPGLALGLPEDRDKPIQLEAARGQFDQKTGTSVYEGNVVITQGTLRVTADNATIYTKDGRFQRIEATGKPVNLRYKPALDKEEIQGTGQRAEYDAAKSLFTLSNNARVVQGNDVFVGDFVEYDLKTDLVKAWSNQGGRIQITLQPRSERLESDNKPPDKPGGKPDKPTNKPERR